MLENIRNATGKEYTLVDYNKSGVPLIEIVTKPSIRSAKDAKDFATKIRQIARYLNISDADMEKGQMRCEPNISIQEKGKWEYKDGKIKSFGNYKLNPKSEVKNIGSITLLAFILGIFWIVLWTTYFIIKAENFKRFIESIEN